MVLEIDHSGAPFTVVVVTRDGYYAVVQLDDLVEMAEPHLALGVSEALIKTRRNHLTSSANS